MSQMGEISFDNYFQILDILEDEYPNMKWSRRDFDYSTEWGLSLEIYKDRNLKKRFIQIYHDDLGDLCLHKEEIQTYQRGITREVRISDEVIEKDKLRYYIKRAVGKGVDSLQERINGILDGLRSFHEYRA